MKIFGKELKLLILDVDGVLLDLMACFDKNLLNATIEMGLDVAPVMQYVKDLRLGNRRGFSNAHDNIKWLWPHLTPRGVEKLLEKFRKQEMENPYPAIAGSLTFVYAIARFKPIALCTTNEPGALKYRLEHAGFNMNWFSYISSWETGHPKPDPRALTIITDSLKIPKENTLFVGDWYLDWECAKKAEIEFIAVLSGGIPKHAFLREGVKEDHVFETLFDVLQIIKP